MARPGGNNQRSSKVPLVLAGFVVLGLIVWFATSAMRDEGGSGTDVSPRNDTKVLQSKSDRANEDILDEERPTTSGKRTKESRISEDDGEGPQFPLVDQILADDGLSNEAAAERLLEIVNDKGLTVLEREEALAHGLNLDFPQFVGVVADPQLPQPLAQRFFDEMLNYNQHRELQVRASVSLVDHEDETMREEAAEQLAFYIGMEEHADDPELLKEEAQAFLEDLAQRPVPEPEPVDPDADIPETAPINPLESGDEEEADDASEDEP